MSVTYMDFFHEEVLVSSSQAPEEILPCITGGCGLWQFAITATSIIAYFLHAVDKYAIKTSSPKLKNFTCLDDNSTHCVLSNGTRCKNFKFFKQHNVTTFTEKLKLVCDNDYYPMWMRNCYCLGMIIGSVATGVCIDKLGLKVTAALFISMYSLTGLLTISMRSIALLVFFMLIHGIFATGLTLIPVLAICDAVGNEYRTLALGLLSFFLPFSFIIFPLILRLFNNITGIIAAVSIAPLLLLIPLLYYKDSPNYICLMEDYTKGEQILRSIARINKCPMSSNVKIRPVQLTLDTNIPDRSTFLDVWKPRETRDAFLSLFLINFLVGYSNSILMEYTYPFIEHASYFGLFSILGSMLSISLCHCFPHKMIIALFEFLKNAFIGTMYLYDSYMEHQETSSFFYLKMAAALFMWTSLTALMNLTPRMFPTELRGTCSGVCVCVGDVGYFLGVIIFSYTNDLLYVTGSLLLITPIVEIVASFWIWNVHKRELPDFLPDCVRFCQFYKPTRYFTIYDTASQHEIEVKLVDLNKMETVPKEIQPNLQLD